MNTATRMALFGLALAAVGGGAAAVGAGLDPLRDDGGDAGHGHASAAPAHADGGHAAPAAAGAPAGLAVAEEGLALVPERTVMALGAASELAFRVVGADGRTVRDFDVEHEREMHVIVVRRDLTGYQHLHPRRDAAGRWTVPLRLDAAGVHRVYADFSTGGRSVTLAADLHVAGAYAPRPLPAPSATASDAGYEVGLDAGEPVAGVPADLEFQVRRDGAPVAGIEPYLGADGHLVALREGDLAFLHVHPEEAEGRGVVRFAATFPSVGRYRLFLQFKHAGAVRTVGYTVEVPR
ncbi:hypothetical protein [Miltoncostaea marina]|uniref:hypothetical protein n=1 Tax=Miltoncostaea marina TaxID=2843215 RepID=UPI001C3E2350|nr:hypothetical protein [Miltoncostaea marina]